MKHRILSRKTTCRAAHTLRLAIVGGGAMLALACGEDDPRPVAVVGTILVEGSSDDQSQAQIMSLAINNAAWGAGGSGGPMNAKVAALEIDPPPIVPPGPANLVVPLPAADFTPGKLSIALFTGGREGSVSAVRNARVRFNRDSLELFQMITPRSDHAMTTLTNRRVLISGGFGPGLPATVNHTAEVFHFDTRTFTATSEMRFARAGHAAATLRDGRVLLIGGLSPVAAGGGVEQVATTELFNPTTGVFGDGPLMQAARVNHSAITLNDGRVLVLGGTDRRSAEVYSPGSNSFAALPNMTEVRGHGHVAVKLLNGKVLILGGDIGGGQPTAVAELFDPATNRFSVVGNMTTARMRHFAVVIPNGRVAIGGGRGPGGQGLTTAEVYDPNSNTFTSIATLPIATYGAPAAYLGANGG